MLQVLIVGIIIAAMATVILNLTLSRTSAMIRIKHKISSKHYLEACMAERQGYWLENDTTLSAGTEYCTFTDDGRTIITTVTISNVPGQDYFEVVYSTDKTNL